jgi:hypothetical protein
MTTISEMAQAVQVLRRVLERARPGVDQPEGQIQGAVRLALAATEAAALVVPEMKTELWWRESEALAAVYGASVRVPVTADLT